MPASVPPAGLVPISTVTWVAAVVTVFPKASCTATWMAGARLAPAVVVTGCTVKASLAAAPGTTSKAALVTGVRLPADTARA